MGHNAVDELGLKPNDYRTPLAYYQARITAQAMGEDNKYNSNKEVCKPPLGFENVVIHKSNIDPEFIGQLSESFKRFPPTFVKDSQHIKKDRLSLLDTEYLKGTARILAFGANKYGVENWKKCEDITLYKDALLRHILAYIGGETHDPETDELHLYHASCNLMFLQWFELNKVMDYTGKVLEDINYDTRIPDTN